MSSIPRLVKNLWPFLTIFVLSTLLFSGGGYFENQPASFFSVVTAWVTINPLKVEISAPAEVEAGKNFKIETRTINRGEENIEEARGEIFLSEGLVLIGKAEVQEMGVIPGGKERKVFWPAKGEKTGDYIISIKTSGELKGEEISSEDSAWVKIVEKGSPGRGSFSKFLRKLIALWSH